METYAVPLRDARGTIYALLGITRDITERKWGEEQARRHQTELARVARLSTMGEMATGIAHELNQPLAAIASYATGSINLLQVAQGESAPALHPTLADLHMALGRIAEQAERAGKVIKSVHDFVRRRDQAREAVPARALLEDILPLVNLQARKLQVRVVTQVDAGLPDAVCDRTMVEQVLLNLARNGMQAMDLPGLRERELLLRVRRAASAEGNRWLEFAVIDAGPGISEDVARQLFTPFYTTKTEGMGLGLSLCRTVVEQHGGYLDFAPHPPRGTVFRFTLPAASEPRPGGASLE